MAGPYFGRRVLSQRPTKCIVRNTASWQSQGLVAWVPLDPSGTAREMVRGNTVRLGQIGGAFPPRADANCGGGPGFDGSQNPVSGHCTFPSYSDYNLAVFTVTAVALSTTVSTSDTVWCRTQGSFVDGSWCLGYDLSTSAWRFTVHDGVQHNAVDPTTATAQKVYFVVGTYNFDGSNFTLKLYVNSANAVATTTGSGTSLSSTSQGLSVFGRSDNAPGTASNWVGHCWDTRYYNWEWTPAHVAMWLEDPWGLYWASGAADVVATVSSFDAATFPWMRLPELPRSPLQIIPSGRVA